MKTYLFEAVHGFDKPGNWGKFMVGLLDEEWVYQSLVDKDRRLLTSLGWSPRHPYIWVFDLQTGEACFLRPGGCASYDLDKHAVWVCPLFEPWLEWLYKRLKGCTTYDELSAVLEILPKVVELPDAEFSFRGRRRPGLGFPKVRD